MARGERPSRSLIRRCSSGFTVSNRAPRLHRDTEVLEVPSRRGTLKSRPQSRAFAVLHSAPSAHVVVVSVLPGLVTATPVSNACVGSPSRSAPHGTGRRCTARREARTRAKRRRHGPHLAVVHTAAPRKRGGGPARKRVTVFGRMRTAATAARRGDHGAPNVPARPSLLQKSVVRVAALSKHSPLHGASGASCMRCGRGLARRVQTAFFGVQPMRRANQRLPIGLRWPSREDRSTFGRIAASTLGNEHGSTSISGTGSTSRRASERARPALRLRTSTDRRHLGSSSVRAFSRSRGRDDLGRTKRSRTT